MRPLRFHPTATSPASADQSVLHGHLASQLASTIGVWRLPAVDTRAVGAAQHPQQNSGQRVAAVLKHRYGGSAADWCLTRDPHGRPALAHTYGLDLSISHAGSCWIMAVSANTRRIGIDIEAPRALPRALALAERYFTADELALLTRLAPCARERAFLRLWCTREAILKAHGRGIAFGLSRLHLDLTPTRVRLLHCDPELGAARDWHLREFVPQRGMIGMLAWRGPHAVLRGFS